MKYLTKVSVTVTNSLNYTWLKINFELFFDKEFSPHIQSESENNLAEFHLKRFLLFRIEYFFERGFKFSHISEKGTKTVSNKRYMAYEFCLKRPNSML